MKMGKTYIRKCTPSLLLGFLLLLIRWIRPYSISGLKSNKEVKNLQCATYVIPRFLIMRILLGLFLLHLFFLSLLCTCSTNPYVQQFLDYSLLTWMIFFRKEYAYFERMTRTTIDKNKRNVMIMGRLTWESFPEVPDAERICMVLAKSEVDTRKYDHVFAYKKFEDIIHALENEHFFKDKFESVWIIGGSSIYQLGLESDRFYRLYLTTIYSYFECDVFFPPLPSDMKKVCDPDVPEEMQEEHGVKYRYNVYEK